VPLLPENDERSLLDAVASSDQGAFTRLVDNYWAKVYAHALAYAKSGQRAQELAQDVFLQVWKKREALREVQDFKNFLFILGKNQIISSMRKKLESYTGGPPPEGREEVMIPDLQLEYREAYDKVMEAIEQLPPTRKMVFKMSRLEGMSYEEIGEKLGISRNTVKQHIVLGLNAVRSYVQTYGDLLLLLAFYLLLG